MMRDCYLFYLKGFELHLGDAEMLLYFDLQ